MNNRALRYDKQYIKSISGRKLSPDEVHDRLFEMMCDFDEFCRMNELEYYLAYGTLIGAVRHEGFIPWDDDVDLFMPRKDYERLKKMKKINDNIDIASLWNDCEYYHPYTYINLADKRTIMNEKYAAHPTGKGLFIDIFPLDEVPERGKIRYKFMFKMLVLRAIHSFTTKSLNKELTIKTIIKNILILLSKPVDEIELGKKIDNLAMKYFATSCNDLGLVTLGDLRKNCLPKKCFENTIFLKFNGRDFPAPCEYDDVLTKRYGDYMTPLPPEERITHGIDAFERIT
ncbi:MAG: LicD family protein [Oscillospiraceae bacterium]|nr:LicD family protein [Oscillospiraceae bacterium]